MLNFEDIFSILKKIIYLLSVSFILFIITLNFIKIINFFYEIETITKTIINNNSDDKTILNRYFIDDNNDNSFDYTVAHSANQLGYIDYLDSLNGTEWGDGINILVIGSDKKDFHIQKSRADSIILLRINSQGRILSISIPRDSLIEIQSGKWSGYYDKIGHSLYWGGLNNLKKTIYNLTGSPVDRVIIVDNFKSFEIFLSIIGGLTIDKILKGKVGIQWIRNRNFKYGDIERCKRTQVFLKKSVIKLWKITKKGDYIYSIFLYNTIKDILITDISKDDFIKILYTLKSNNFDPENDFLTAVLPGEFGKYKSKIIRKDLTCWYLDDKAIKNIQFLFYSNYEIKNILHNNITFLNFIELDLKNYLLNIRESIQYRFFSTTKKVVKK